MPGIQCGGKSTSPKKKIKKEPKPSWLEGNLKPKDLKTTREWKGFTWHWCSQENGGKCKGNWRRHSPTECKGTARDVQVETSNPTSKLAKTLVDKPVKAQKKYTKPKLVVEQAAVELFCKAGLDPEKCFRLDEVSSDGSNGTKSEVDMEEDE
jgi:hypothetical protein